MKAPTIAGAHRRFDPLTGRWVLVSVGRTTRPWQGEVEEISPATGPSYSPDCYLCPGNIRAGGVANPRYESTFVFDNDFPALRPDAQPRSGVTSPLFRSEPELGVCRVACYSPRHDMTMARMDVAAVEAVIDLWSQETAELGRSYRWVQVFENSGPAMGASSPHPHCQIWAGSALPYEAALEDHRQREYYLRWGSPLLMDYVEREDEEESRIVVSGTSWAAIVPYWAVWPFEALIVPRRRIRRFSDLVGEDRTDLARVLRELLIRYDNLFEMPFPYSMGWHGAPSDSDEEEHWQLHAHVYPPLLRSPSIRKFMVGYELLAEPQRDLSAEEAAECLRAVSCLHYSFGHSDDGN